MLGDIKAIVEIVEKLFGLKGAERARIVGLLDELSQELIDLANHWKTILERLERSNILSVDRQVLSEARNIGVDVEIRPLLFEQRSQYQALLTFLQHREAMGTLSPLNTNAGASLFALIEQAISLKGRLIGLVEEVVYPGDMHVVEGMAFPQKRVVRERETPEERHARGIHAILRKAVRLDSDPRNEETMDLEDGMGDGAWDERFLTKHEVQLRRNALAELRACTEALAASAGEFRMMVALYKAGQIR